MAQTELPKRQAARAGRKKTKKKKKFGWFRLIYRTVISLLILAIIGVCWLFFTNSGESFRYLAADTLITTQHRKWAKYIIGEDELKKRVAEYNEKFEQMGTEKDTHTISIPAPVENQQKPLVEIEPISGNSYKGYIMTVNDPTKIRLGVPDTVGKGEKVSSMVNRLGAIAGVNAGGFDDPNWKGNGFKPIGVVISQGKLYYNGLGSSTSTQIVGIDKQGKMIAGHYSLSELSEMNVQEAVTFQPRIIVNGKGQINSHKDGWGIAPRTAMGQRADGAILFVVIDGRQPGYSIGADLYDVQNIMLEHGAVIAANLDGGSSTVLVKYGGIVNKPSSQYGERYLPTAFLVFDDPENVTVPNIWQGLDPKEIDGGKK
ncbi:phosphodiester glycosidase family protein [Paenibacillus pinistramenti]|uniref:phosphodiester glycosidase family protein n=1 Tax=Paenibacillus pinistramenti TaxID=1768003 RepID=UPI001107C35F|nr:phosphodiester glycosidase family protein [Paenibacillus pinistramenti]